MVDWNGDADIRERGQSGYDRDEKATEQAAKKGCRVVYPKANELFVDLDSKEAVARFYTNIARILEYKPLTYEVRPSPSGREGHAHAYVWLEDDVDDFERIALQALLGSDLTREVLSWQRLMRYEEHPTLFFEKVEAPVEPTEPAREVESADEDNPFS